MIPAQEIISAYGLGKFIGVEKVEGGVLNHNYKLNTDKGSYFVKSIRPKVQGHFASVYAVEMYMGSMSIPSVQMMKTINGEVIYENAGQVFTLYPFIESSKPTEKYLTDYKSMGELLGKIHLAGDRQEAKNIRAKECKKPDQLSVVERLNQYQLMIEAKNHQTDLDLTFVRYIKLKQKLIPTVTYSNLPNSTLIHGDYHPGNVLFAIEDRRIIGVCDWEKTQWAPRSYELARSILHSCFGGNFVLENSFQYTQIFLEAYSSTYPVSRQEFSEGLGLGFFRLLHSTWLEEKYYDNSDSRANHLVEHQIALINLLEDSENRSAILSVLNK